MNTSFASLTHKMQRAAVSKMVDVLFSHMENDREKAIGQVVDLSKQFYGDSFSEEAYQQAKNILSDPDSKWSKLINSVLDQTDPHVARTTALNLGYEAFFRGTKTIRENRVKYQCNIPWLILLDPTSACNMHCAGCWAGEYGNKNNLSFERHGQDRHPGQGAGRVPVYAHRRRAAGAQEGHAAAVLKSTTTCSLPSTPTPPSSTSPSARKCCVWATSSFYAVHRGHPGEPTTAAAVRATMPHVMHAMDLLKSYGMPLWHLHLLYQRTTLRLSPTDAVHATPVIDKGAHFGFGTSTTCPWATTPPPS